MKALLLAGGMGTRLRPITNTLPKCLVPIKGKPLLEIWFDALFGAGITEILINTHYLAEQVENFVLGSNYRSKVKLVHEEILLGTAGTILKNKDFFRGGDGMVIHADNYCLANLGEFIKSHSKRPEKTVMSMLSFTTNNPENCGVLEVDHEGVVIQFHEKKIYGKNKLANGAIYILSEEFLRNIDINFYDAIDFSYDVIPKLMGRIYSHHTIEKLIDIGTVEAYIKCNQ